MLFYLEHITSLLFIHNVDLSDRSWRETYYWLFNVRWIGTPRDANLVRRKALEQKSSTQHSGKQSNAHTPSRGRFALRRLGILLCKFVIMVVYYELCDEHVFPIITDADLSNTKRSFIRRIARRDPTVDFQRELLIRTWATFNWFFGDYMARKPIPWQRRMRCNTDSIKLHAAGSPPLTISWRS
ncbi:hypothetical protein KVT40_003096 [Elsinoe batatas]|uniref:Uncharacterized protein n=1 Tax=Elsinoe batatas TaxID=2601811 RepID=A0A8K0L3G7_9PEZI|nr:hypothetical protein KVT40_003096 [Elsinoe batatas]